ncbi:MAG: hypothetical protein ACI4VH_01870 [Clostridia bacterium]
MEILEKLGNNPLIVSLITLLVTTLIGAIGYLFKKVINHKKEMVKNTNQQSNIIQNFNSGITYKEAREIAEEVVENKLNKMKKQ